jgi:hypothetical protein
LDADEALFLEGIDGPYSSSELSFSASSSGFPSTKGGVGPVDESLCRGELASDVEVERLRFARCAEGEGPMAGMLRIESTW